MSKIQNQKSRLSFLFTLLLSIGFVVFLSPALVWAATHYWVQSDWSDGIDGGIFPDHTDNKTNWTKYSAVDANLATSTDLSLSATTASSTIDFTTEGNYTQEDVKENCVKFVVETANVSGHFENNDSIAQTVGLGNNSPQIIDGVRMMINGTSYEISNIINNGDGANEINFSGVLAVGAYNVTSVYGTKFTDGKAKLSAAGYPVIEGTAWTGPVVTVGSGKDYADLPSAINAATEATLYLVYPGIYTNKNVSTSKTVYIRGMGNTPDEVLLQHDNTSQAIVLYGAFILENIKVTHSYAWRHVLTLNNISNGKVNKCYYGVSGNLHTISSANNNSFAPTVIFRNCYIQKGYAHFNFLTLSNISLEKIESNSSISTYQCEGSFAANDSVTSPTAGYGVGYGDYLISNPAGAISYPLNNSYVLTTLADSQIDTSAWAEISSINITQTTPANTSIKYLVSFDNRATWKYWSGSVWAASSLADLQTDGMTKTTLEGLSSANWSATGGFQAGTTATLDFAADLKTTDSSVTPELDQIKVNYSTYPSSQTLTSSAYNTESAVNVLDGVKWDEDTTLPTGTGVKMSVRTGSDTTALDGASWSEVAVSEPGSLTSGCTKTDQTITCDNIVIPAGMKDGTGDQWIQYKIALTSTGASTPTVDNINLVYSINSAPSATFDNDFSTWESGGVTVNYNLIDTENDTLNISQSVSSGVEYSTDNLVWSDAADAGGVSEGLTGLLSSASGENHIFVWDSAADLAGTEDSAVYLRVRPNDETVDADAWVVSNAFGIDNVAPSSVGVSTFGAITVSSIEVIKPTSVAEGGSGLYQWQARRDSTTELGFNATSTTSVADSFLLENTQYAYDAQFTDNQSNTSNYGTSAAKYTLADIPTNLTGTSAQTAMDLSADSFPNDASGSSGYYFANTTKGTNSGWLQTNSWQDTGLTCGTSYDYSIKYRNGDGTETDSISMTKSTTNCVQSSDATPPAVPTDIELSVNSDNQIVITWTDPADGDFKKIDILRSKTWLPISCTTYAFVLKGVETFIDTDVSIGDAVKYIFRAKDNNNNGSISDEYSITVENGSPEVTVSEPDTATIEEATIVAAPIPALTPLTQTQIIERCTQAGVTESEVDSAVSAFADLVKDAWHAPFITRIRNMAVLSGYPDGTVQPDRTINRAELAKIAAKAFDLSTATESFDDVPASSWYAPFVGALQSTGAAWTTGSDFRPAEGVTRGEALWTLLAAAGVDLDNVSVAKLFPDVNTKHRFAAAITYAAQNGIVSSYENGNFEPGDTLTRGQVAKIVVGIKDL